jgi:membrane protease YdiL (CAAX protease family)
LREVTKLTFAFMKPSKELFMRMGLLTLLVPLVIVSILYYFNTTEFMIPVIIGKMNVWLQLGLGVVGGFVLSGMTWLMGKWKYLDDVNFDYTLRLGIFNFSIQEILFLSFCAGVGEEIVFRGMIQPWLGILTTSFMFIALHGYLSYSSWPKVIFGLILFAVGTLLGILGAYVGLLAAIVAHILYDIVAFQRIQAEYEELKKKSIIPIAHEQEEHQE